LFYIFLGIQSFNSGWNTEKMNEKRTVKDRKKILKISNTTDFIFEIIAFL